MCLQPVISCHPLPIKAGTMAAALLISNERIVAHVFSSIACHSNLALLTDAALSHASQAAMLSKAASPDT
jgi:hypothetical protein